MVMLLLGLSHYDKHTKIHTHHQRPVCSLFLFFIVVVSKICIFRCFPKESSLTKTEKIEKSKYETNQVSITLFSSETKSSTN